MCRWLIILLIFIALEVPAQSVSNNFSVSHLTVDLIEETDVVYSRGFSTQVDLSEYDFDNPAMQVAEINTTRPRFG